MFLFETFQALEIQSAIKRHQKAKLFHTWMETVQGDWNKLKCCDDSGFWTETSFIVAVARSWKNLKDIFIERKNPLGITLHTQMSTKTK